jgi:hypothetical protein
MLILRNINEIDEIELPSTVRLRTNIKQILKDQKLKIQSLLKRVSDDEL